MIASPRGYAAKPRTKLIAGGTELHKTPKSKKKKVKKAGKTKKKQDENSASSSDNSGSWNQGSPRPKGDHIQLSPIESSPKKSAADIMQKLNSSYGSINESINDSPSYHTPPQSPWNVKLRKTPKHTRKLLGIGAPTVYSPSKDLGSPSSVARKVGGDWTDPDANRMLEDFSTPRQSPWQRKKKVKMKSLISPSSPDSSSKPSLGQKIATRTTTTTKPRPSSVTKKKKKTGKNRDYGPKHHKAATVIAALVRGKRGRKIAKIRKLQYQLDTVDFRTAAEIRKIEQELTANKKEFKKRAKERFQKNLNRHTKDDTMLEANGDCITELRNQNAVVRAQNHKIARDLETLKINNSRLEDSLKAGEECYGRLKFHDDTVSAENKKLNALMTKYKTAVDEHKEAYALHKSYYDAEVHMIGYYKDLLKNILGLINTSHDRKLRKEINDMAAELEDNDSSSGSYDDSDDE